MACNDKRKFKTSEAAIKSAMRTKGAIDKFHNILDTNVFRHYNFRWSAFYREHNGVKGNLFLEENDKAVPNKAAFHQIDASKGIFYKENEYLKPLQSKKDFNNLVNEKDDPVLGVAYENDVDFEDNSDELDDVGQEQNLTEVIQNTLFKGEPHNTSAKNILENIVNSGIYKDNHLMLDLIGRLSEGSTANVVVTDRSNLLDDDTYMQYNIHSNTIYVSKEVLGDVSSVEQAISNFIHEVYHEKTLRAIRSPKNESEQKLLNAIRNTYFKVKLSLKEEFPHETSSVEEFTAAMFSNKAFQDEVKELIDTKNFWDSIVEFIKNLLGVQNISSYDDLIKSSLELIDKTEEIYTEGDDVLETKYNIGNQKIEKRIALDHISKDIETTIDSLIGWVSTQSSGKALKDRLTEISKKLKTTEKKYAEDVNKYRKESINIFLNTIHNQINAVSKRIDKLDKPFTSYTFNSAKVYIDSFLSLKDELEKAVKELSSAKTITKEESLEMSSKITNLDALSLITKNKLVSKAKEVIALDKEGLFTNGYKEVYLRYKYMFEKEAREQGLNKDEAEAYVSRRLSEDRIHIKKETNDEFINMLDHPIVDINAVSATINSEKDFNHPIINIFSSILDKVKHAFENIIQPKLIDLQEKTNTFLEGKRTKSSDEVFKKFVEVSKDGVAFFKGFYKIEFYDTVRDLEKAKEQAFEEFGEDSKEYAEAQKNYATFVNENTEPVSNYEIVPTSEWHNDFSEFSSEELAYYNTIKNLAIETNKNYGKGGKGLKKTVLGASFYQLPRIRKEKLSMIKTGNLVGMAKEYYDETFKIQSDQTDLGEIDVDVDDTYKVEANLAGKEVRRIPVHYRAPLDIKHQSYDLPTIYALELQNSVKFQQRSKVANDLVMFRDIIQEGKFIKNKGFGSKQIVNMFSKNKKAIEYSKEDAVLIKMLDTILNNRLYDKTTEYAGTIAGHDINKIEAFLRGTVSRASMALNFIAAPSNLITGKTQTLLEVIRDPNLHMDNVIKAEKFFYNHIGGFINDMGRNVHTSIGNQLLLAYGGLVSARMLQNTFEHNKAFALLGPEALYFGQEAGEHHIQAIHTFTILDSAKIINKNGDYLNTNGKIVKTKAEAASLLDISTLENGKLTTTLKGKFYTTLDTMNAFIQEGGSTSVRSYIQSSLIKAQGNYSAEYASEIQRTFYGKMFLHFKKHIISPLLSRWRGLGTNVFGNEVNIKFNYDLQRPDEGSYVTFLRFIRNTIPKIKTLQLSLIAKDYNSRPDWEKANIRRTMVEMAIVVTMSSLAFMFASAAGAAGDDDDDSLWYAAAVSRRLQSEASQYYDITEAWRTLKNPISTLGFLEDSSKLMGALLNTMDPLEVSGTRLPKLENSAKRMFNYVPGSRMYKDAEKSYNYIDR